GGRRRVGGGHDRFVLTAVAGGRGCGSAGGGERQDQHGGCADAVGGGHGECLLCLWVVVCDPVGEHHRLCWSRSGRWRSTGGKRAVGQGFEVCGASVDCGAIAG